MGWLDNSTNNIILDAVLTDYGRQALARNDGTFRISAFSLGDDEVDYSIITKYGRTVGREKIEKNTPIFEAFTNQSISLKYKLVSVPRPLLYLPSLELEGVSLVNLATNVGNNLSTFKNILLSQSPNGGETMLDPDLLETNFDIHVPDMFLTIDESTPIGSADINKIALYNLSTVKNNNQVQLNMTLRVKYISNSSFDVYGRIDSNGNKVINTFIRVIGKSSGLTKDIPVTITKQ